MEQRPRTLAETKDQVAATVRDAWREDIRIWMSVWTTPVADPRRGISARSAYESWSHWDDHQRQHARGRDRGCLYPGWPLRADAGAIPSTREFGMILAGLGVPKMRVASGVRYGLVPVNEYCPAYPDAPCRERRKP